MSSHEQNITLSIKHFELLDIIAAKLIFFSFFSLEMHEYLDEIMFGIHFGFIVFSLSQLKFVMFLILNEINFSFRI